MEVIESRFTDEIVDCSLETSTNDGSLPVDHTIFTSRGYETARRPSTMSVGTRRPENADGPRHHEHQRGPRLSTLSSSTRGSSTDNSQDNGIPTDTTAVISVCSARAVSETERVKNECSPSSPPPPPPPPNTGHTTRNTKSENMGVPSDVIVSDMSSAKRKYSDECESSDEDQIDDGLSVRRKGPKDDGKVVKEQTRSVKKRQRLDDKEIGIVDSSEPKKTTTKQKSTTLKSSLSRATSSINGQVKHDCRKVVMEDDNIVVYQDVYSVMYKNADDLYKSVSEKVKRVVKEAEEELEATFKKGFDTFSANVERLVNQNLSRIRQAATKLDTNQDSHGFAIITPKGNQIGVFHIASAVDKDDLAKKMNRCKNQDKLILEFNSKRELNVGTLKDILKSEKMMTKSKNDFTFDDGDLKDLHAYLVKLINRSSIHQVNKEDYKLAFLSAEQQQQPAVGTKRKVNGSRKEKKEKKEEVRRSYAEIYTDDSNQEEDEEAIEVEDTERCRPKKARETAVNPARKKRNPDHERSDSSTDEDYHDRD